MRDVYDLDKHDKTDEKALKIDNMYCEQKLNECLSAFNNILVS